MVQFFSICSSYLEGKLAVLALSWNNRLWFNFHSLCSSFCISPCFVCYHISALYTFWLSLKCVVMSRCVTLGGWTWRPASEIPSSRTCRDPHQGDSSYGSRKEAWKHRCPQYKWRRQEMGFILWSAWPLQSMSLP